MRRAERPLGARAGRGLCRDGGWDGGLELSAGLSEEGQGSGCRPGADLGGKGRSQSCLAGGLSGCMGYRGHGWVRWDGDQNRKGTVRGLMDAGVGSWPEKGGN